MVVSESKGWNWTVQLSKPGEIEQSSFTSEQEAREYAALQSAQAHPETTLTLTAPDGRAEVIPMDPGAVNAAGA
jgi:hypothetical protein